MNKSMKKRLDAVEKKLQKKKEDTSGTQSQNKKRTLIDIKADEELLKPYKQEMDQMAQDIFKNDMLGGSWHMQEFLIKHNIELGSDLQKMIIAKTKIDVLMIHFENLVHVSKNPEYRKELIDGMLRMFEKLGKAKEPIYWDPKQDLCPPSVREADIFNRGMDQILIPIMNLAATGAKYKLQEDLRCMVDLLKTQKVKPGAFTMSEWQESEENHRPRDIGKMPKKTKQKGE